MVVPDFLGSITTHIANAKYEVVDSIVEFFSDMGSEILSAQDINGCTRLFGEHYNTYSKCKI